MGRSHLHEHVTDAGLAHLPNLTRLSLWNNRRVTDKGLSVLPRLRVLNLSGAEGVIGHGLAHLPNLTQLRVTCNYNIRCLRLAAPAKLTSLAVEPIKGFDVPAFLCTLTNLTELDAGHSSNLLTDAVLEKLASLTSLKCWTPTDHQKALLTGMTLKS